MGMGTYLQGRRLVDIAWTHQVDEAPRSNSASSLGGQNPENSDRSELGLPTFLYFNGADTEALGGRSGRLFDRPTHCPEPSAGQVATGRNVSEDRRSLDRRLFHCANAFAFREHEPREVDQAGGVSPLVVIPGQHLGHSPM